MTYLRAFKDSPPNALSHFRPSFSPKRKKQLHKFLQAAGYCHQWIPNIAALAKSLYAFLPDITPEPISWPSEALPSFEALELTLSHLWFLAYLLLINLFHQYCHENNRIAAGILG